MGRKKDLGRELIPALTYFDLAWSGCQKMIRGIHVTLLQLATLLLLPNAKSTAPRANHSPSTALYEQHGN